ncbi:hypothetical protein F2Q69_00026532 [Brassica cretica]|uniref:Uncharacterized protein n=1 Tax=Brassica cretica TaxID=69181 RepID=A0A8S9RXK3_BRACR|nr:hypothetical protein F2Q69_00026532 [Brassica cretica]
MNLAPLPDSRDDLGMDSILRKHCRISSEATCKFCDKWGHSEVVCAMKSKGKKRKDFGSPAMKVNGEKVGSPSYLSVGKEKESVLMEDSGDKVMDVVDSEESAKKLENGVSTSGWAKVSPAKTRRSFDLSAQKIDDVEISALKFFVLSLEDVEEGELVADEKLLTEVDDDQLETEDMELLESDQAEDIDQQVIEEKKVGLRRGRKAKDFRCACSKKQAQSVEYKKEERHGVCPSILVSN